MGLASKEPYKGVRDFYPEDEFVQNYIFDVWKRTAESFGYVEYDASILEPADLYRQKSGEEIVNEQTYTFTDRGDREVTLRPEMTPSVARMVAARQRELSFPLRWYSIPNLFRYERPQRGRLREHWQLNVDLFGLEGVAADAEIIEVAFTLLTNFGLAPEQFEIRINDRRALSQALDAAGLSEEQKYKVQKLLDKKNKIDNFNEELAALLEGKKLDLGSLVSEEAQTLIDTLSKRGINNTVFDPYLMRGFDYYTGIVFEVFDTGSENNRSIFGGGRYDNLLDMFGNDPVPAVGFGTGDVTTRDLLETYGLLPEYRSSTDLTLCLIDRLFAPEAATLATILRSQGINVAVDYSGKRIGDQLKKADRDGVPFTVCIGEDEVKSSVYTVKDMRTGEEQRIAEAEVADYILNHA